MTSAFRFTIARAATICALSLAFSAAAFAQTAERTAADAPSQNRETKRQHDSLTMHFLRSPKAKPAAGTNATGKFRGRPEPVQASEPAETPLPVRKKKSKQ